MWQIDILPISTTPFSLHLTSYNLKPSQPHANIIKPKLQQIFAKKKMPNLQEVVTMQFWFNPQVFHSFLFTKP